jgi:PAS domain-containing protein
MLEDERPPKTQLINENSLLRDKVHELEQAVMSEDTDAQMLQILRDKEESLLEYAKELKQKSDQMEYVVKQLNERNEEMANLVAVLRLYQLMFENEPSGIIGLDTDARIVQFNAAAVKYFGVQMHSLRLNPVNSLSLPGSDIDLYKFFEEVVNSDENIEKVVECSAGRLIIRGYRLDDIAGLRGVVFRIGSIADNI